MQIRATLLLLAASISLAACSSMRGNVVPQSGPTMEQVYDSMGSSNHSGCPAGRQQNLSGIRHHLKSQMAVNADDAKPSVSRPKNPVAAEFKKVPNPGLKMYVYPHFAGNDQVPIPGYYTEFDGYRRNHYELSSTP